ncbi:uncharacterized protein UHOD_11456 [Ustilago sp. UG-2017b]|nr:uncharacterized protein UHOD_11456 [Ustilago sp. UG-2017b]
MTVRQISQKPARGSLSHRSHKGTYGDDIGFATLMSNATDDIENDGSSYGAVLYTMTLWHCMDSEFAAMPCHAGKAAATNRSLLAVKVERWRDPVEVSCRIVGAVAIGMVN